MSFCLLFCGSLFLRDDIFQFAAKNLTHRGLRNGINKNDFLWHLVTGKVLTAIGLNLLNGQRRIFLNDHGLDALPGFFVRNTDHAAFQNLRHALKNAFNFVRVDVKAADQNHVFLAISNRNAAVAVHVADITGAFAAGLIISTTSKAKYIELKFAPLSYLLLTPIFFASIGLKVELPEMNATIVIFSILLVVVAVLTKWIGCGLGAKLCGLKGHQCEQIGVGMVCRGEVALIVADKGAALGLMPEVFFGPVIIMVVATTILTPILLKFAYRKSDAYEDMQESSLVDRYDEVEQLDYIGESLIRANEHMMKKGKKAEKAASETKK